MKRVEVEWVDSAAVCQGWQFPPSVERSIREDGTPGMLVNTVGWLFMDEPEYVVVVQSDGMNQIAYGTQIPKEVIRNVWELRRK